MKENKGMHDGMKTERYQPITSHMSVGTCIREYV